MRFIRSLFNAPTRAITILTIAALATSLFLPQSAQAHVLRSDGAISAELHVLPDDAPVTNTPVKYELTFEDTTHTFKLQNCDCKVVISKDNKVTATQTLTSNSATTVEQTITFKDAGDYTFKVTGTPINGASFEHFSLEYPVRVGEEKTKTHDNLPLLWSGLAVMTSLILVFIYTKDYRSKRKGSH